MNGTPPEPGEVLLSVVVPAYNEAGNVRLLHGRLREVLSAHGISPGR